MACGTMQLDPVDEAVDPPVADDPPDDDGDDNGDDGDDRGDLGPWVTVATFWKPTDAHLARIRLESADVDCVIVDEYLVATDWLFANAVGGIKLQVPAAQAAVATELLARPRAGKMREREAHRGEAVVGAARYDAGAGREGDVVGYRSAVPTCPACGAAMTYRRRWNRRTVFATILLLGFPLPLLSRRWECAACDDA